MLERLVDTLRLIFPPSFITIDGAKIVIRIDYAWYAMDAEAWELLHEAEKALQANKECLGWVITMPGPFMDHVHVVEMHARVGQQLILW